MKLTIIRDEWYPYYVIRSEQEQHYVDALLVEVEDSEGEALQALQKLISEYQDKLKKLYDETPRPT